jgi:hypothetical protein
MRWIADVGNLADRMSADDGEQLVALARRTNSKRIVGLGLRMARHQFGAVVTGVPERLVDDAAVDRLVTQLSSQSAIPERSSRSWKQKLTGVHPNMTALLFWAKCRERRIDRLMCVLTVLLVPTDNDPRGALGWITRPVRLATQALKSVSRR